MNLNRCLCLFCLHSTIYIFFYTHALALITNIYIPSSLASGKKSRSYNADLMLKINITQGIISHLINCHIFLSEGISKFTFKYVLAYIPLWESNEIYESAFQINVMHAVQSLLFVYSSREIIVLPEIHLNLMHSIFDVEKR